MADTVLPCKSVTPSGVAQSQPTPEEIAEGLANRPDIADAVRAWLLPDECGLMNEGEHDDDLSLLAEEGLVDSETFDDTDLGRAVADVLAKRGAR